ncbi:membrane protein [Nocardiopsis chromatogenes]|uniref:membrane protein n=1 Tax=Nocardiopsis chromatogenes TaxID=280239 RepID=UPI000476FD38|nr:membrane protein [Nocardiopsis chromatogenes]
MAKLFLSLHVVAAIIAIGPVTVAASMFPPALRRAHASESPREGLGTLRLLHRICRVYAYVGIAVPVFGFATASALGVLGDMWLTVSIVLTAAAAAVLALAILPGQAGEVAALDGGEAGGGSVPPGRLAMLTGVFNLLWVVVTVLMIVRPGSTTGA